MLGALIGAGASLLGGIMGNKANEKAGKQNAALQREFAQNSVQWKVEDSKKAGIHPLYGIGAQTITPQASFVGDTSLPTALADVGQNIGSAIDRTRTAPQKLNAVAQTAQALELERAGLQNDFLRTQIAEAKARTIGPAFPAAVDPYVIPGQGDSGVKSVPLERINSAHGHPFAEAGPVTDVGYTRTHTGGLAPVYSKDAKERLEDDYLGMLAWNLRNRIVPSMTLGAAGPRPPGHKGFYDIVNQEWVSW